MKCTLVALWWLSSCSSSASFATPFSPCSRSSRTMSSPFRGGGWFGSNDNTPHSGSLQASSAATSASLAVSSENLALLSERGRQALERLMAWDTTQSQTHVYGDWPEPGTEDDKKQQLAEQLADLDQSYPGGLTTYLTKAQRLLQESADGVNPFAEFEAKLPEGESLTFFDNADESSMPFSEAEQAGLEAMGQGVVFVLVAGGLGERLGYSGVKLELETNLCTNKCYLHVYIKYIQAMQYLARQKTGRTDLTIPLVIMTSGDTDALTRKLLNDNDYFGMDRDLLTIVTQDKVAALKDGQAGLALEDDDRWTVQTKPHGHGDVHHLLYREGLVDDWEKQGIQHVIFLQDTNALVINSVVPALGVSVARDFVMNSICIPRLAGEAAGAIAKLEHKTDPSKSLVINVEYNQLDPLLKAQGTGDVPDEKTGYSPFPGNANNLVMRVPEYAQTLRGEDQGVVLEFVNPKYKDEKARTDFKKPTRLECMMQDIPKLFQKELSQPKIGFCMFDRWFTFSPAKNSLEAGQESVQKGSNAPGTLSSAESDKYIQNQRKLQWAGFEIVGPEEMVTLAGIPVTSGPHVLLCPAFSISQKELKEKIVADSDLTITRRSSLVLEGHHLKIDGLNLDGALVIRAGEDTHVTVQNLNVQNKGWSYTPLPENDDSIPEAVQIRGYTMTKHETAEYILNEPGHFVIGSDGKVQKVD